MKDDQDVAIVNTGTMVVHALIATEQLAKEGIECAVVNARFIKPLHSELILGQAYVAKGLMTIGEDALAAGLGEGMARRISSSFAVLARGGDSRQ